MKLIIFFLFIFFTCASIFYSLDLESMDTGFIGGVTLFDKDGPFTGINNPALMVEYGRIKTDSRLFMESDEPDRNDINGFEEMIPDPIDVAYDPKAFEINYHPGRIFILDSYTGIGFTSDFLNASRKAIPQLKGSLSNADLNSTIPLPVLNIFNFSDLISYLNFLSLGMLDLYPLFDKSGQQGNLTNAMPYILQYDQLGGYAMYNLNWLSLYRNGIGFCAYTTLDGYAGLLGTDRSLVFFLNDPVIKLNFQTGAAVSLGGGEMTLPFIEKFNLGFTLRGYYLLTGEASNLQDYMEFTSEITNYVQRYNTSSNVFDISPFLNGNIVKEGWGTALDIGMTKAVTEEFTIAAKLSDILSPIYWTKSKQLGWLPPDLSLGMKYTFLLPDIVTLFVNEPAIYFQMDDMFYTYPVSFFSKLHLGIDSKILFDTLHIGAGINQGYPTLGATLHLTFAWLEKISWIRTISYFAFPLTYAHLKLNLTYYGKELGRYPGELGFYMYNVGAELYWGF